MFEVLKKAHEFYSHEFRGGFQQGQLARGTLAKTLHPYIRVPEDKLIEGGDWIAFAQSFRDKGMEMASDPGHPRMPVLVMPSYPTDGFYEWDVLRG